jgi:hypothetical protein
MSQESESQGYLCKFGLHSLHARMHPATEAMTSHQEFWAGRVIRGWQESGYDDLLGVRLPRGLELEPSQIHLVQIRFCDHTRGS